MNTQSLPGNDFNEEQALLLLKKRIIEERGLDFSQYKDNYMKRRLAVRMRATKSENLYKYLQHLKRNPEEYDDLIRDLTINVTEFFRDSDVYEALIKKIIPDLLKEKALKSSFTLRVWSAGCSSGEEPYSVTIAIMEALRKSGMQKDWSIRVTATDIDEGSLKKATEGVYPENSLPKTTDISSYFEKKGDKLKIKPEVSGCIRFVRQDLNKPSGYKYMDLVLCRNVLIYFSRDKQINVIRSFEKSMASGGFLVLGKSETLPPAASSIFEPILRKERVYRKRGDAAELSGETE